MKTIVVIFLALQFFGCKKMNDTVVYTFVRNSAPGFDLKPSNADTLTNFLILDHLIETFFKIGPTGQPEPSAVESWSSTEDLLNWTFVLRKGLKDENGFALKPSYWCLGIQNIIPTLPSPQNMILLSKLDGWNSYLKNEGAFPAVCDDEKMSISFKFLKRPDGIKEFLTMPVLGFWSLNTPASSFISTGAFKLTSFSPKEVNIERRIKTDDPNEFNKARIRSKTSTEAEMMDVSTFELVAPVEPINHLKKTSRIHKSSPTQLIFTELNDSANSNLSDINTRRYLFDLIQRFKKEPTNLSDDAVYTESVFFDYQPNTDHAQTSIDIDKVLIPKLRILVAGSGVGATQGFTNRLIENVLKKVSKETEIQYMSGDDESWKLVTDRKYDVRIGAVEAGTFPDRWVAEMMFCSQQGISFIDPKNKFCNFMTKNPNATPSEIAQKLSTIMDQEVTLLPLFNKASIHYVGLEIDDSTISANSPLVRFDRIKSAP